VSTKKQPTINNKRRARFTLFQKIVASYAAMAFFTMTAFFFSLTGLFALHKVTRDMVHHDFATLAAATKLRQSILEQQRYAGKQAILKAPEFRDLFHRHEKEFLAIIEERSKAEPSDKLIKQLETRYNTYRQTVDRLFASKSAPAPLLQQTVKAAERVTEVIDQLYASQQRQVEAKLAKAEKQEREAVTWTLLLSFAGFILGIGVAAAFLLQISAAFRKLKKATVRIANGEFDHDPQIPPGDEIGDLAQSFTAMAARLKELEQINLDASPLTRLPGNIPIEATLSARLAGGNPFAVCYADLDNFKAYNDRYGYIKASEVIKTTGEIIDRSVGISSDPDAFVGHIGGDDFVIILNEQHAGAICEQVIGEFDNAVKGYYTAEDLAKGAIEGIDRFGVHRVFPIVSISIAVIVCQPGEFDSAAEIAEAAAEVKSHLKSFTGSNYLISRHKRNR